MPRDQVKINIMQVECKNLDKRMKRSNKTPIQGPPNLWQLTL